ncbi:MAG: carbonic anhydrase [Sphingomonadaceae bacterium]|nr:carbonic anhydrase [Sphingomonadaceae bacterium]
MPEFRALLDGYRRFRLGPYRAERERWDRLAQGQNPPVMVIACSDSRVDPTRVFDSGPGEMFVLRNIANLVPPVSEIVGQSSVAAALEYAVTALKVHQIVVFGHARCGGIAAALAGEFDTDAAGAHVRRWMEVIAPARAVVRAAQAVSPDIDPQRALEQASIRLSLDRLRSYDFIAAAEAAGELKLQGVVFDIADGSLRVLNHDSGVFEAVPVEL